MAAVLPVRDLPAVNPSSFHRILLTEADSRYPSPRASTLPSERSREPTDTQRGTREPQHSATAPPDAQMQFAESSRNVASASPANQRDVESFDESKLSTAPSSVSVDVRVGLVDRAQRGVSGQSQLSPEILSPLSAASPRHPALGSGSSSKPLNPVYIPPPIMPLSASPGYSPPVSANPRAYAQQPTYITPTSPQNPIGLSSPPQEEVCVECAMRDQDMIDVDVTSPGIWERESDVAFNDLLRRELEDEANGIVVEDSPKRPRARGGRLTEDNLRLWLSINPREPASKQQTLKSYIKSQRTLLEAEALARARAMQEAKQLDNRMRDTYSQLRRSAYDTGANSGPVDDFGGVRIKSPQSPTSIHHPRSQSREVTLLENGMIVEHVDVRKEEKEAKERRRKEERRARKSSRGSVIDVNSIISAQSYSPNDTGPGLLPYSRYSQASSARPTSVLTAPLDRTDLPRAYSQASFSDVHSLGSPSPRRSRFFGMKNLSAGWMSQDSLAPSGFSGSMMDMHVALQNEAQRPHATSPIDGNARRSQLWPSGEETVKKKKKKGLAKIWGLVTGSSKQNNTSASAAREPSSSYDGPEDDGPLAPPPPLSYLVNRGRSGDGANGRHSSTPSLTLTSLASPAGASPSTNIFPSPSSSRDPGTDVTLSNDELEEVSRNSPAEAETRRGPRPDSVMSFRDKSLPPLPMEAFTSTPDGRPHTVVVPDFMPPSAPFRTVEMRRQSFGGLASRPVLGSQALPTTQPVAFDQRRPFGARYDEYGLSRRSLGRLDNVQEIRPTRTSAPSNMKRRSRFGLSSLLGKKQTKDDTPEETHRFPPLRRSGSDGPEDLTTGYATSTSRHSAFSLGGRGPRISVTSRKAIEELVSQDAQFVAYRYPSNDQHLDILR